MDEKVLMTIVRMILIMSMTKEMQVNSCSDIMIVITIHENYLTDFPHKLVPSHVSMNQNLDNNLR